MERKRVKKLVLNTETIRELTSSQLEQAVGGIPPFTPVVHTLPLNQCIGLSGKLCD